MTMTTLIFTFVALVLSLAVFVLWIRVNRPPKEDPRLSRGLQLLQNKIAVLTDLSDRTDRQAQQIIALLDERAKILQAKILQAQETMMKIDQSMAKSLDVAKIFQDKIPHEEIIERQNTAKYVRAAKLAHQGRTVEEIMVEVDLPRSEVEFIAKVNRDELMFSEEHLPDWAKEALAPMANERRITEAFAPRPMDLSGMQQITENFKSSVREAEEVERQIQERQRQAEERRRAFEAQQKLIVDSAKKATKEMISAAGELLQDVGEAAKPIVRKVQFPRIDKL